MKQLISLFVLAVICQSAYPQEFEEEILVEAYGEVFSFGDFDQDGDLDILLFYETGLIDRDWFTVVYENTETGFQPLGLNLPAVQSFGNERNESATWIDYNNDGLLDIFLVIGGFEIDWVLFKNNGDKTFSEIQFSLINVDDIFVRGYGPFWTDFDNDGDLDLTISGNSQEPNFEPVIRIYENDLENDRFLLLDIPLGNSPLKSVDPWGDFNNDGYLDLLTLESTDDFQSNLAILKNNGDRTFSKIVYPELFALNQLPAGQNGAMVWVDYNSDGHLDIHITGQHLGTNGIGTAKFFESDGNEGFTEINLEELYFTRTNISSSFGDLDQDGDIDILQTGLGVVKGQPLFRTTIFLNKNNTFSFSEQTFLRTIEEGTSAIADLNGDLKLDFIIAGERNFADPEINLYYNTLPTTNDRPAPPQNLVTQIEGDELVLSWDTGSDNKTPSSGLGYNIYLIFQGDTVVYPYSNSDGTRMMVNKGNAENGLLFKYKNPEEGTYQWGVQTIDNSYIGSAFSEEISFEVAEILNTKSVAGAETTVFPNPFHDYIDISSTSNGLSDITFLDISGKSYFEEKGVSLPYRINTIQIEKGIYVLRIVSGSKITIQRIVKN